MKKIILICMFAATLHTKAQEATHYEVPGWIKVYKDNYVGYLDEEGEEIIPAIYDEVGQYGVFKEDWALVSKNGLMGFVDRDGAEIVSPRYDGIGNNFGEYHEDWLMVTKNGYFGFIDTTGLEVVQPIYTGIEKIE